MNGADHTELPDVPRVDELFNRALVAQLAEQRAQRETFAEVERKLEGLERLVNERLGDLARQLGADGQLESRIELLEETLGTRLTGVERAVRSELDARLGPMAERLSQVEQSIGAEDTAVKLVALEATVRRRLTNLEEAVRSDDVPDRLGRLERAVSEAFNGSGDGAGAGGGPAVTSRLDALERLVTERLGMVEESLRSRDVVRRLETLESSVAERLGLLEETVRSEEIGRRLKSMELALDERSGRIEEFVKTADLEGRIDRLGESVDERLGELQTSLADAATTAASLAAGAGRDPSGPVERVVGPAPADEAMNQRLAGLEGSLKRLQEDTAARLDDLRAASMASEAGILERIIAESQVVGAHFQAVRPVVEAAVAARPEIEAALAEVRRLAEAAREAAAELLAGTLAAANSGEDPSGPYRVESLEEAAASSSAEGEVADLADSVFQPPEETPIPDRRFGILPRRDK